MQIPPNPGLPTTNSPQYENILRIKLNDLLRKIAQQLNQLTDGRVNAITNASTALPTTGEYKQGDFVRNSAPAELGLSGSKYVLYGWICVVSGEPGTWKECRFLTGN